jgi:hypothetical protein
VLWAEPEDYATRQIGGRRLAILKKFLLEDQIVAPTLSENALMWDMVGEGYLHVVAQKGAWDSIFGITPYGWHIAHV